MRPDIPWNVAGIPPEAREAARAAARREGLSVGEWMTRRILRSFSDAPDDMTPAREQWASSNGGYAPLPETRSGVTRRDTQDMLDHVTRSENESSDVYRRIEEQLRNVARRLESTERNQSENNRAMSKAASEINVAAREQAQAFDQLGGSVMSLADRLERVERTNATDTTRDAIRGLHQGLSRLADQISNTANQSASQISALASSLEAMANRVAQARQESENIARNLDQRISQVDQRINQVAEIDHKVAQIDQRLSHVSAIDDRLRAVERAAQTTNDTLSHALSSIESRKDEDAAALRRDAETASAIARLEDNFAKMEMRGTDPSIDRRLSSIERSLTDIVGRLEAPSHQTIEIEDNLKRLSQRIEASEARQREQVAELRAALTEGRGANPFDALPPHPVAAASQPSPFAPAPAPASSPFAPAANFDAPPFADMAPAAAHGFQQSADAFAPAFDAPPPAFGPEPTFGSGDFGAADPFAPPPPPPPLAEPDSYLSAARRSARAAAAAAEAERGNRMGRFSWGAASPAATEAKPAKAGSRKTLVWIGVLALLVVFAIVAGAILSQKVSTSSTHTLDAAFRKPAPAATTTPPVNNILPPDDVTSPPTDVTPPETTAPSPHAHGTTAPINVQPRTVAPAPVKPVPSQVTPSAVTAPPTTVPGKPQAATTPLDKLTQLANAGNGKAALVVGLKYLDGDGVAVSEADAAKWLERAAEQGLPVAQYRLGTMYERGRGVTRDPAKAVQWYQRAAQAGNRKAMHNLAVAYAGGQGTAKNLTEAARWFTMAAALGLADSQFNLAVLYERGMGVPQNLVDAYKWYSIAAAGGDTESKTRVDALATQLSPDDKAAAQRSAAAFRAKPLDPRSNVAPTINDVVGG